MVSVGSGIDSEKEGPEYLPCKGPIVRINPYEIHINDPEMIDEVYPNQQKRSMKYGWAMKMFGLKTGALGTVSRTYMLETTFSYLVLKTNPKIFFKSKTTFLPPGPVLQLYFLLRTSSADSETWVDELHRIRRDVFAHYLSKATLLKLEPGIQSVLDRMVSRFEDLKGSGRKVNLFDVYASLTGDIIGQYAFAQRYGLLDEPDFSPYWHEVIMGVSKNSHILKQFGWMMPLMQAMPPWLVKIVQPQMMPLIEFQQVCFPPRYFENRILIGDRDFVGR